MTVVAHDVFKHILSFKDPRYELVRGGGKTPSAEALSHYTVWSPATFYTAMSVSPRRKGSRKYGGRSFCVAGFLDIDYEWYHTAEMEEARRRAREENVRFWEAKYARLGMTPEQAFPKYL